MSVENRETFRARLERLPYRAVITRDWAARIMLAYMVAKNLHRAQTRRECGTDGVQLRYFEHVRRAALIALDELRIPVPILIAALLLHDGREDRPEEIDWDMVSVIGGEQLVVMLRLLTKEPKEGYLDRLIEFGDWLTLVAKGCDRLDNLRSLVQAAPAFQRKQVAETREKYFPLLARMVDIVPPEYRDKARILVREIHVQVAAHEDRFSKETAPAP